MRQLIVIMAVMAVMSAGVVTAVEYSALSNIFTLDTRTNVERIPLEHSAMSNIFTLDTRSGSLMTTFTIGSLTVKADSITQTSANIWEAVGNVVINDFLYVTGAVTLDEAAETLTGSGQVSMKDVPYLGDLVIFQASQFSISSDLAKLASQAGLETKLTIGFLEYELTTLKLVTQGVEVGGKIALPEGVHLGAVGEKSYVEAAVRITKGEGLQLMAGKLELKDIRLGGSGYKLDTISLEYDRVENRWEGLAELAIPHLFNIEATVGIVDGQLNKVGVGVDNLNKPILYTHTPPPVPVVYLQRIYGELDELVPGPPPVIFKGEIAFTAGPQIGNYFAIRVDLGITIDTSGELIGEGDIYVISEDGRMAGGRVVLSARTGLTIQGELRLLGIIRAEGRLTLDLENNFQGILKGSLSCPEDWWFIGGKEFGYVLFYVDNTRIVAGVEILGQDVGICYDGDGFDVPCNFNDIKQIKPAPVAYMDGPRMMRAPGQQGITIPEGIPLALFRLSWSQGDTDFDLIAPDGTRITPDIMATDPENYLYRKNLAIPEAYYAVKNPQPGAWQVYIPDVVDLGTYEITVHGGNTAPQISMEPPNVSGQTVLLRWTDKDRDDDAVVSLYYDIDARGADGSTIVTGISEDDESDSFTWDTSDVPSGIYYVYAKIDDGKNPPRFSYTSLPITVAQSNAPGIPANFRGDIADDSNGIELAWDSVGGADGYTIYYTDTPQVPGYSHHVAVGQLDSYVLTDLIAGRTYGLAVAAYDADGVESLPSEGIAVAFLAGTGNNPPHITSTPSVGGKVGFPYTYSIVAEDVDGDVLSFRLESGPVGGTIHVKTGMVQWTPTISQAGNQSFVVVVEDGQGGMDQQSFTVTVSEKSNYRPTVMLLAPAAGSELMGDALVVWKAADRDSDDLSVSLFYSTDGVHYWQIVDMLPNTGSYTWDTTQFPDSQSYGLQIVVNDGTVESTDLSEGAFAVKNNLTPWDINGDGVVDISDLMLVAGVFGQSGEGLAGDLNSDGEVGIIDLMIVAVHFGETTNLGAPASPQMAGMGHIDAMEDWLQQARTANDGSELFLKGIPVLEHLLSQIVPSKTALMQNYPNPFNPDTWIPYQLNEGADVSIVVYDATGRIVRSLDIGHKDAGVYRTQDRAAHWNGRNEAGELAASGAYFVLLKSGEYQQVRRIVLIR